MGHKTLKILGISEQADGNGAVLVAVEGDSTDKDTGELGGRQMTFFTVIVWR